MTKGDRVFILNHIYGTGTYLKTKKTEYGEKHLVEVSDGEIWVNDIKKQSDHKSQFISLGQTNSIRKSDQREI